MAVNLYNFGHSAQSYKTFLALFIQISALIIHILTEAIPTFIEIGYLFQNVNTT
jgi:hypothetical protein